MGHLLAEPEGVAQFGPLGNEGDDAAVVGAKELPKHQQREQLRLREVVARERARVRR